MIIDMIVVLWISVLMVDTENRILLILETKDGLLSEE